MCLLFSSANTICDSVLLVLPPFEYRVMCVLFLLFQILEQEKVHDLVTVKEFPLYMVPLDEDGISFELELSEKVCRTFMGPILTYDFMCPFP